MKKTKDDLVHDWFKKAESDLKTIHLTIDADEPPTDTICFHAQQVAEKYLKGFLCYHEVNFPKIHDLEELVELCIKIDKSFEEILDIAAGLSSFAVEIRYPDDSFEPDYADTFEAVSNAKTVKDKVLATLSNY